MGTAADVIIFIEGLQQGQRYPLSGEKIVLGRSRGCDIIVDDEGVSRRHAEVFRRGGGLFIRDMGSTNGTYVNDGRVAEAALASGDKVSIGDSTFIVQSKAASSPDRAVMITEARRDPSTDLMLKAAEIDLSDTARVDAQAAAHLAALHGFALEISSVLTTEKLLDTVLESIFAAVQTADRGAVMLLADGGRLAPKAVRSRAGGPEDVQITLSRTLTKNVLETGGSVLSTDVASDDRFKSAETIVRQQLTSFICCPLKVKDKLLGLLYIDSFGRKGRLTKEHLALVSSMAVQASICIENARLYDELMNAIEYNSCILRSMASGIVAVDVSRTIQKVNSTACELLAKTEGELVGRRLADIPGAGGLADLVAATLKTGIPNDRKEIDVTIGGEKMSLGVTTALLENYAGSPIGAIANFRDITALKRLAEQVKRSQHLAALGEMAAGVAHEIRNPLNSIRGFAQLLAEKSQEKAKEYLDIIIEEVDRMNGIVQDLLDFARQRELTMAKVDLARLMDDLAVQMRADAQAAGVSLEISAPRDLGGVIGNEEKLKQVLLNIMRNGMEAMKDGGALSVAIEPSSAQDVSSRAELFIRVKDTGCGIPEDVLPKIFDPFFTTKDCGTGLELSICQKIVEQHSGRIEVESSRGKGSTFTVVLPYGA